MADKINRFTQDEWDAFAGAERFKNGTDPYFYYKEFVMGGCFVIAIADANGIEIWLCGDGENMVWRKEMKLTAIRAFGELGHLVKEIDKIDYAPDLSYYLDHDTDFRYEDALAN